MSNVETADGEKETLVKITRGNVFPKMAWDTSETHTWSAASLQTLLNSDYIIPDSGTYQNTTSIRAINNESLNMIENVNWGVGAIDLSKISSGYYDQEKTTIWPGRIAIIQVSDYVYATSGLNNDNQSTCVSTSALSWNIECSSNNWFHNSFQNQEWMFSEYNLQKAIFKDTIGRLSTTRKNGSSQSLPAARPTLYLKASIEYIDGEGTSEKPFIINSP